MVSLKQGIWYCFGSWIRQEQDRPGDVRLRIIVVRVDEKIELLSVLRGNGMDAGF